MRAEIMSSAVDDYVGLWEIRWRGNTLFPSDADEAFRVSQDEVARMLTEGLLALYETSEYGTNPQLVTQSDCVARIRNDWAWEDPQKGARQLRIAATSAGEEAYYRGEFRLG